MTRLVTSRTGDPYWADVVRDAQRVRRVVLDEATGAIVKRTQRRLRRGGSDRLANALGHTVISDRTALIRSNYGGPGVIRPVNKRALFWAGAPHPFAKVNGKGIEPLIRAEARRLRSSDLPNADVTIN